MRNFFTSSVLVMVSLLSAEETLAFTLPAYYGVHPTTRIDTSVALSSSVDEGGTEEKKRKMAVLLCPAQFCVPVDYTELLDTIKSEHTNVDIVSTRVAPLPRTEWIKVARQLPTKDFIDANLSVKRTLDWYFEAIEVGLSELFAEGGEDVEVCVIGHSIGGWVARAYLGGISG